MIAIPIVMVVIAFLMLISLILVAHIDFFMKHTKNWKIPMWRFILAFHKHESTIDGGIS